MCGCRKMYTHPMVNGNSEGVGVSKAKIFKGRYEAKLAGISRGMGGSNQKKMSMGYVWIFSGTTK